MRRYLVLAALVLAPRVMRAQSSPIVDLLLRARGALNDLHYGEADSLAQTVLTAFDARLNRDQRVEALSIGAAAMYPEPAGGGVQRPDSALSYLRRIVRADPAGRLRSDLSWPGLDSLFGIARQTTFAAGARPQAENVLVGPRGEAVLEAFATRPARFRLTLVPASGTPAIVTDSSGPTERALMRLRGFAGDRPTLASGEYTVEISATDTVSGEAVMLRYPATVVAPALAIVAVPHALDSTQLRPEIAPPARKRGILAGLLVGGGAMLAATLTGPEPLASEGADSRGYAIGAAMAAGAIIGGLLDKGRPLPENVVSNARLRAAFAQSVQQAEAENRRLLDAYRLTITIQMEAR
jgi:hypothetical protein